MTIAKLTNRYVRKKAQEGRAQRDEWITDAQCKWLWVVKRKGGSVTFYAWNQKFKSGERLCKRQRLGRWPEMSVATARKLADAAYCERFALPSTATVRQGLVYLAPTNAFAANSLDWLHGRQVLDTQVAQLTGQRMIQLHTTEDFETTEALYLYLSLFALAPLVDVHASALEALCAVIGQTSHS